MALIRAIKIAASEKKISISTKLKETIDYYANKNTVNPFLNIVPDRLYLEIEGLFFNGQAKNNLNCLIQWGLAEKLLGILNDEKLNLLYQVAILSDDYFYDNDALSPAFFYYALHWDILNKIPFEQLRQETLNNYTYLPGFQINNVPVINVPIGNFPKLNVVVDDKIRKTISLLQENFLIKREDCLSANMKQVEKKEKQHEITENTFMNQEDQLAYRIREKQKEANENVLMHKEEQRFDQILLQDLVDIRHDLYQEWKDGPEKNIVEFIGTYVNSLSVESEKIKTELLEKIYVEFMKIIVDEGKNAIELYQMPVLSSQVAQYKMLKMSYPPFKSGMEKRKQNIEQLKQASLKEESQLIKNFDMEQINELEPSDPPSFDSNTWYSLGEYFEKYSEWEYQKYAINCYQKYIDSIIENNTIKPPQFYKAYFQMAEMKKNGIELEIEKNPQNAHFEETINQLEEIENCYKNALLGSMIDEETKERCTFIHTQLARIQEIRGNYHFAADYYQAILGLMSERCSTEKRNNLNENELRNDKIYFYDLEGKNQIEVIFKNMRGEMVQKKLPKDKSYPSDELERLEYDNHRFMQLLLESEEVDFYYGYWPNRFISKQAIHERCAIAYEKSGIFKKAVYHYSKAFHLDWTHEQREELRLLIQYFICLANHKSFSLAIREDAEKVVKNIQWCLESNPLAIDFAKEIRRIKKLNVNIKEQKIQQIKKNIEFILASKQKKNMDVKIINSFGGLKNASKFNKKIVEFHFPWSKMLYLNVILQYNASEMKTFYPEMQRAIVEQYNQLLSITQEEYHQKQYHCIYLSYQQFYSRCCLEQAQAYKVLQNDEKAKESIQKVITSIFPLSEVYDRRWSTFQETIMLILLEDENFLKQSIASLSNVEKRSTFFMGVGLLFERQHNYHKAKEYYLKAIEEILDRNNSEMARQTYIDFHLNQPVNNPEYHFYTGKNIQTQTQRLFDALIMYQKAVNMNPQHYLAYMQMAIIYKDLKEFEKAQEICCFLKNMNEADYPYEYQILYGTYQKYLVDIEELLQDTAYQKLTEDEQNSIKQEDLEKYIAAIESDPESIKENKIIEKVNKISDASYLVNQGILLQKKEQIETDDLKRNLFLKLAKELYLQVIRVDSGIDNLQARRGLTSIFIQLNELQQALEYSKTLILISKEVYQKYDETVCGSYDQHLHDAYAQYGCINMQLENYDTAKKALNVAKKKNQASYHIDYGLATIALKIAHNHRKLFMDNMDNMGNLDNKGNQDKILFINVQYDEAEKHCQEIVRLYQEDVEIKNSDKEKMYEFAQQNLIELSWKKLTFYPICVNFYNKTEQYQKVIDICQLANNVISSSTYSEEKREDVMSLRRFFYDYLNKSNQLLQKEERIVEGLKKYSVLNNTSDTQKLIIEIRPDSSNAGKVEGMDARF